MNKGIVYILFNESFEIIIYGVMEGGYNEKKGKVFVQWDSKRK